MQGTGSTGLQHKRENTSRNTRVSNTEKHTDSNFGAQDSRGVGKKSQRNQANIMGERLVRSKCYVTSILMALIKYPQGNPEEIQQKPCSAPKRNQGPSGPQG